MEFELSIALDSVISMIAEFLKQPLNLYSVLLQSPNMFSLTQKRLYQKNIYKIKILQRKEINLSQLGNQIKSLTILQTLFQAKSTT